MDRKRVNTKMMIWLKNGYKEHLKKENITASSIFMCQKKMLKEEKCYWNKQPAKMSQELCASLEKVISTLKMNIKKTNSKGSSS